MLDMSKEEHLRNLAIDWKIHFGENILHSQLQFLHLEIYYPFYTFIISKI